VKAAAARNVAEQELREKAARELAKFSDAPPIGNPLEALAKYAGEAEAWKAACEARVQALTDVRYESTLRVEQLRAEVALYVEAQKLCHAVNVSMAKLDIDARLTGVKEATARMLAAALGASLDAAGLEPGTADAVRREFVSRLRVIEAA
jgi:hypothetical protein